MRRFLAPLAILAGLRSGFALTLFFASASLGSGLQADHRGIAIATQALLYLAAGCWLLLSSRKDQRVFYFGAFLVFVANAFSHLPLSEFTESLQPDHAAQPLLWAIYSVRFELLAAVALWLFVRDFPAVPLSFGAKRWLQRMIHGATFTMVVLLAASTGYSLRLIAQPNLPEDPKDVRLTSLELAIWPIFFLFILAAVVVLAWKALRSRGEERRRGKTFFSGFVFLGGPAIIVILLELTFGFTRHLEEYPFLDNAQFFFVHFLISCIPLTMAYAVIVDKVLDVKLIARKALQHGLARSTAMLVIITPLLAFATQLYVQRHERVVDLFSGPGVFLMLGMVLLGGASYAYRQVILDAVDRRFFREQYDAKFTLQWLADQLRGTSKPEEMARLVCGGIDRALHLERVSLLIADHASGQLVDPMGAMRPLDRSSRLAKLLVGQPEPMRIDIDTKGSPHHELPEAERHWLVDGRVQMMAPCFAYEGELIGLIAMGAKKSELPFLNEDEELLTAISASAGLAIELLTLKRPELADSGAVSNRQGRECLGCKCVYPPGTGGCPNCHLPLQETVAPYILRNLYRFEERIGTGGMAVVYRATDLTLGRTVAIKTLPRVSPEAAMRLRREAITAASVEHPGLAAIYGFETWEGTPMLVQELLAQGTLADRLAAEGGLGPAEVLSTGIRVAEALDKIHSVGILHRDIKPSNIGYNQGSAKLLDFGIAKLQSDLRGERALPSSGSRSGRIGGNTESWDGTETVYTATGQIAGTLSYLSPEALNRAQPDPSFDLWSLSVVLYEALTGENLFYGPNLNKIIDDIRNARIPELREQCPECPPALDEFLTRSLHRDQGRRPQNGQEYVVALRQVQRQLYLSD